MNSTHGNLARVISTGFLVSLIFSIVLFWTDAVLRKIGKDELVSGERMSLSLALDLGDKKLSDPNLVVRPPRVICEFANHRSVESDIFLDRLLKIGYWIRGYELASYPGQFGFDLNSANEDAKWGLNSREWHAHQGLIVTEKGHLTDKGVASGTLYVGPKGFGDTPDISLGRFSNPQLCSREDPYTLFIYDTDQKAFFKIDFALEKVTSKSWADKSIIAASGAYFGKFTDLLQMYARDATRWETDQEMKARLESERIARKPLPRFSGDEAWIDEEMNIGAMARKDLEGQENRKQVSFGPRVHGAVLGSGPWAMDDQGTVYRVDRETLLLGPSKGQLPRCGKEKTHDPSRLLAYCAWPLFSDQQYLGLAAASLSRDGSEFVMVSLDPQGRETDRSASYLKPKHYRYGRVTLGVRTVLGFAQPLSFSAASSLLGPRTEAIAGYRSLFVLPFSTPARIAGDRTHNVGDRVGTVVMWNVFTWIVGLFLAIAVIRDLKQYGMPGKTQKAWLFACMGFGWIAAITYLLTRPRAHFVTCTGCGRARRTDQALCLHCEADWDMCELQAPGWRVVD